jgi:hypothetical protein
MRLTNLYLLNSEHSAIVFNTFTTVKHWVVNVLIKDCFITLTVADAKKVW